MAHKFFEDKIPHKGYSYEEFQKMTKEQIEKTDPQNLDKDGKEHFEYTKLNMYRSNRIEKNYTVTDELKMEVAKIKEPQLWMIITESWCGDSAQNLPYIAKIAVLNSNIDLRIILRDSNPEIMDLYLTNGTRSIPILVAFDAAGNEKFKWGPRPGEVQALIKQWRSDGIVKPELYEKLHLWYSKNKGKNIEEEMLKLITNINQVAI